MPDESQNTSELSDHAETGGTKEDAETTAARRELKQTSISEKGGARPADESASDDDGSKDGESAARSKTPDPNTSEDRLKEQVASPKKKRAHDQLEEPKESEDSASTGGGASNGHNGTASLSRTDRSEPEKKRPRDKHADGSGANDGNEASSSPTRSTTSSLEKPKTEGASTGNAKASADQTSQSAFAKSAFGSLAASSASPFGTLGASGKPSVFGAGAPASQSPFGAAKPAAATTAAPKFSFGPGPASGVSPFAGANGQSTGFGSALGGGRGGSGGGGGFGSIFSGPRLTSFAKPGEAFKSDKPAKPFGAPDSDEEDGSGDSGSDEEGSGGEDSSENDTEKEKDESKTSAEDKKKPKLQKVIIDDGEAGEVTLLQVRAKMYQMEKDVGWKERGGGMLKVNVPESTVEFDELGNPKPETFDASVLDTEDSDGAKGRKNVRLIMRQDHTLRVILNTAILPAMEFHLTKRLKSSLVLFMAFEGTEVTQVQMMMSEVNATALTNLTKAIQRQLQDV